MRGKTLSTTSSTARVAALVLTLCTLVLSGCFQEKVGYEAGEPCNDEQQCATGLYCDPNGICQKSSGEGEGEGEGEGGSEGEGEGEGEGLPGSGCRCPSECTTPRDGFPAICLAGICTVEAQRFVCAGACPDGFICEQDLLPGGGVSVICVPDCGMYSCDGACDNFGAAGLGCLPTLELVEGCDSSCGSICPERVDDEDGDGM